MRFSRVKDLEQKPHERLKRGKMVRASGRNVRRRSSPLSRLLALSGDTYYKNSRVTLLGIALHALSITNLRLGSVQRARYLHPADASTSA